MQESSPSSFRLVFVAITIASGLILAALILNHMRPARETAQPTADYVEATGKCVFCHRQETSAIVHQFESSRHAKVGLTCFDCHHPVEGQATMEHRGFMLAKTVTALNCKQCHTTEYAQFLRSRHAAPAWAAIAGAKDFTPEQVAFAEQYHKGAVQRPPNVIAGLEGEAATIKGCQACHSIGQPNADGSIGTCTQCHSRHSTSLALAREPTTCGQCHMGPDHSQLEIYTESKHGVLFAAQKPTMNLAARPKQLTTKDMPVPTCATCHMSGLEGMNVTHNVSERSSYWLFAEVSDKRPDYLAAQTEMKALCTKCHAAPQIDRFYTEAEAVVDHTNEQMKEAQAIMAGLRKDGLLTPQPFDEPIEYVYFDLWHYFGRTAKHGAFMGGADFVQWHGNYEILRHLTELRTMAAQLRAEQHHAAP